MHNGFFTTVVTALQPGTVGLDAQACLVIPGTQQASQLCSTVPISRSAVGGTTALQYARYGGVVDFFDSNGQLFQASQALLIDICPRVVADPVDTIAIPLRSVPSPPTARLFTDILVGHVDANNTLVATSLTFSGGATMNLAILPAPVTSTNPVGLRLLGPYQETVPQTRAIAKIDIDVPWVAQYFPGTPVCGPH